MVDLIIKYKNKGVIVDTNLLILFFIGLFDEGQIKKNKRTKAYTIEDFTLLKEFLKNFKLIITPNIITELTNLCSTYNNESSTKFFSFIKSIINKQHEIYVETSRAIEDLSFCKFGLTDTVIHFISKKGYLVLTDDFPLYGFLSSQRILAINFNHIRSGNLLK